METEKPNTLTQTPPAPAVPDSGASAPIEAGKLPDNLVVDTPGSTDFSGTPAPKKFPTLLIVVVVIVLIILVAGVYLYSNQNSPLNGLNNNSGASSVQPVTAPPSSLKSSAAADLKTESDSIVIEDVEADFTEVDRDLQSL